VEEAASEREHLPSKTKNGEKLQEPRLQNEISSLNIHQSLPNHVCSHRVCECRVRRFRTQAGSGGDSRNETHYKCIVTVDQSDLEFLIPGDNDTYVDPDIKLYIAGKLTKTDGTDLDATGITAFTITYIH
jgi:hypothetical protein